MPIFKCPDCYKEYELNIKVSGKTGKCSTCGNKFVINFQEEKNKEANNLTKIKQISSIDNINKKNEKILSKLKKQYFNKDYIIQTLKVIIKSPPLLINVLLLLFLHGVLHEYHRSEIFENIIITLVPLLNIYFIKTNINKWSKIQIFGIILMVLSNLLLLFLLFQIGYQNNITIKIFSLLLFLTSILSLHSILRYKRIKSKFYKFLKWFSITILILFIGLLTSIYVSSLNSYKESDFNIPKDAFQTKFGDIDPYSEDNGFTDFIDFIDTLENNEQLRYFDILSKCTFDLEYVEEGNCERDKDWYITEQKQQLKTSIIKEMNQDFEENKITLQELNTYREIFFKEGFFSIDDINKYPELEKYMDFEKYFNDQSEKYIRQYKNLIHINAAKYINDINSKKYIIETPEYSDMYTSENCYGCGKYIVYTHLFQYSRGLQYIAYTYFENGEYDTGIKLLLEHQVFADNLMNKTEGALIQALVAMTISKSNLEIIEYILLNYELSEDQKSKVIISLENKIDEGLIENYLKKQHIVNRTIFQYLYDTSFISQVDYIGESNKYFSNFIEMTKGYLFFSVKETELISDKLAYDSIYSQGKKSEFVCEKNLNNYIGRLLMCDYGTSYESQYQKEEDLRDLRQSILEKLQEKIIITKKY